MKALWLVCVTTWVIVTELLVASYIEIRIQKEITQMVLESRKTAAYLPDKI